MQDSKTNDFAPQIAFLRTLSPTRQKELLQTLEQEALALEDASSRTTSPETSSSELNLNFAIKLTPGTQNSEENEEENEITKLCRAAEQGDLKTINDLVQQGVDINERSAKGDLAIFVACQFQNPSAFRLLLEKKADIAVKNKSHQNLAQEIGLESPWTVSEKQEILAILAKHGVQLPPIHHAACIGDQKTIMEELKKDNLLQKDEGGLTAFVYAGMNDQTKILEQMLEWDKDIIEIGYTREIPVTKERKKISEPLGKDSPVKMSPLGIASVCGHFNFIRWLLSNGAQTAADNFYLRPPLLWAAYAGKLVLVKKLIQEGLAKTTERDKAGNTALLCAASSIVSTTSILQWLLTEGGAKITERNHDNETALLISVAHGHPSTAKWLLSAGGANIQERDKRGTTVFAKSSFNRNLTFMKWLFLESGLKERIKEQDKLMAISYAAFMGNKNTVQWLLTEAELTPPQKEKAVQTALEAAIHEKHFNLITFLILNYCRRSPSQLFQIKPHNWLYFLFDAIIMKIQGMQGSYIKQILNYQGKEREELLRFLGELLFTLDIRTFLTHIKKFKVEKEELANLLLLRLAEQTQTKKQYSLLKLEFSTLDIFKLNTIFQYCKKEHITRLMIQHATWTDDSSWRKFISSLEKIPLTHLDLSDNRLSANQVKELGLALLNITTLTQCVLDRNNMTYNIFYELMLKISSHRTLKQLSLRENHIYETDEKEISRCFRQERDYKIQVDISGNFFVSKGYDHDQVEALRFLLRETHLTVQEFMQAKWIREEEGPSDKSDLFLKINGAERQYKVNKFLFHLFQEYRRKQQDLRSDAQVFRDLQRELAFNLRKNPYLAQVRLQSIDAIKEQKRICKQLLSYHPLRPLKAYLKNHPQMKNHSLASTHCLLCPEEHVNSQQWNVYFLAKKAKGLNEHAMFAFEGIFSYGQRIIRIVHLQAAKNFIGLTQAKIVVIDDYQVDFNKIESIRQQYHIASFSASKHKVKRVIEEIDHEKSNGIPNKYSIVTSSPIHRLSNKEQEEILTNCQKWALEKLESCLELQEKTLQNKMSISPSNTAKILQQLKQTQQADEGLEEKHLASMISKL